MKRRDRSSTVLRDEPSILVIETGLVGELLVTTPALRALRRARPASRITVIASPGSAAVLVGNPAVDRLLPLTKKDRGGIGGLLKVGWWIRSRRFDAALVFHTSFRSALLAAFAGVPIRAGLACEGRGFLLTHRVPRDRAAYEVDEHLRVLGLLGIEPDGRDLEIHLLEEEREEARRDLAGGGPLVGIHPGASREIRRWPIDRFAELSLRIEDELAARVALFFGPKERALADAAREFFEARGRSTPFIVFPKNVRMLAAYFERVEVAVTNNTGPMHLAAAMKTPGVFIHGPTPVERWHPPGDHYVPVFAAGVPCRPCDSPRCRQERLECMEGIDVAEVFDAVARLLEEKPPVTEGSTAGASEETA